MWDVGCGIWDVGCGMWEVCGMWDVGCGMWGVGCGIVTATEKQHATVQGNPIVKLGLHVGMKSVALGVHSKVMEHSLVSCRLV